MSIIVFNKTKVLVYFFLINFIITVFHIDTWNNGNTTSRILPIITYFETGTFQIDKYHQMTCDKAYINGHYYSDKAPLPTLMIIPVFGLLKSLGIISSNNGSYLGKHVYALGAIICSIIPFVLLLCFTYFKHLKNKNYAPALISSLPFYASFIFIYAGTFFNHIISAFFLLVGYIYLKDKRFWLAGMFAGLAFLCDFVIAVFIAVWAFQILWNEKKIKPLLKFCISVFPSIIFILIFNYHFTGSAFTMLYKFSAFQEMNKNYGFRFPTLETIWGILFSSYKGMLFYAPVLLLVIFFSIKKLIKYPLQNILHIITSNYLIIPSSLIILIISSYFLWWGGWSFGPRLVIFIIVLIFYDGLSFISSNLYSKILFWILVFFGLVLSISAKITVLYSIPSEIQFPLTDLLIIAIKSFEFNNGNILTYLFEIKPIIANFLWLILFGFSMFLLSKLKYNTE